jgi:hypothetical protein
MAGFRIAASAFTFQLQSQWHISARYTTLQAHYEAMRQHCVGLQCG